MLMPRKTKYRKTQRGKIRGRACRGTQLAFGQYGLKAIDAGLIKAKQIEAACRAMTRFVKREGKIWIRIFPDKPMTFKGVEVSMGGGKGEVAYWAVPVKPGQIIFEMDGISQDAAQEALRRASYKLPIKVKFISR